MSTLVAVAQKAVARFFRHPGAGEPLEELETLEHPESALHNGDLVTDTPGTTKERMGPQVRAMQPNQTAKEREAENFARQVAGRIRDARLSHEYDRAVIVAAPEFLGLLRASLDTPERDFVSEEIVKNVATHDLASIEAQLQSVIKLPRH